jgi:uroporphyrinogen-III synthase
MRVLVTRPEADAARTAVALAERGHTPVLAPLMTVVPTGEPAPDGVPDALVLTSAHAVAFLAAADRAMPVFAIGERTAEVARQAGFRDVRASAGDGAALASSIAGRIPAGRVLLHVAGRHRKAEPEASLRAAGFAVRVWEAYEAKAAPALPADLAALLGAGQIDAALHYSRRSAALLLALADAAGLRSAMAGIAHLCLSADAAAPLGPLAAPVAVAAEPHEVALLAVLDRLCADRGSPPVRS